RDHQKITTTRRKSSPSPDPNLVPIQSKSESKILKLIRMCCLCVYVARLYALSCMFSNLILMNASNNFYSESQSDLCYSRGPGREHVAWVLVTLGKSAALLRKVQEMCSAQELTSECLQRPGALSYKARRGRRATAAAAAVVGSRCLSRGREVAPIPVRPRNGADPQSSAYSDRVEAGPSSPSSSRHSRASTLLSRLIVKFTKRTDLIIARKSNKISKYFYNLFINNYNYLIRILTNEIYALKDFYWNFPFFLQGPYRNLGLFPAEKDHMGNHKKTCKKNIRSLGLNQCPTGRRKRQSRALNHSTTKTLQGRD
ncbi:unnamed protein product, partial [Trichogramma brassicae]